MFNLIGRKLVLKFANTTDVKPIFHNNCLGWLRINRFID